MMNMTTMEEASLAAEEETKATAMVVETATEEATEVD